MIQDASRPAAVRVEPLRLKWIEALVVGDDEFAERFGTPVVAGWAGFPEAQPAALEAARRRDADPWGSHLIFDRADGALVGFGGFKGPPRGGAVEIGYAIAPERRRRGLATAAAVVMIERARAANVGVVVAHTLAERNASTAVLTRCGFAPVASADGREQGVAGEAWRWELDLAGTPAPERPPPA